LQLLGSIADADNNNEPGCSRVRCLWSVVHADLNKVLDKQSDTMAATSAAGEAVARRIGDYADAQAKATSDPAWAEGGAARAEMQAAGAALVGGLGGGIASAAGSAAGAGLASISAGKLNALSDSIADSSPTGNADMDRTLGNIVANVIATGAGAAVGGGAGATSAANVDRFNRQLHPEEKTLAKQIADKSGGKYTQTQVEDQMRIMGATVNGTVESGAPDTLIGQKPTDAGAGWLSAGLTADGKPILTQTNAAVDPQLQAYIVNNYASAAPGAVPSIVSGYTASPTQPQIGPQYGSTGSAGTICPSGNCGAVNTTVTPMTRDQLADSAASVSTAAGRFGAVTGAAAEIPTPYSPAFATAAFAATVAGWIAGGVEQVARPNPRPYISGGLVDIGNYLVSDRFPMAGLAINEVGETIKGSSWMDQFNKGTKK